MASITDNARSSKRAHPFRPLSTLSSGYDSTTVTVLARQAGLQDVISFSRGYVAPSLGEPTVMDSGAHVAQILGLTCHVIEAREHGALEEALFFAGDASAADVHYLGPPGIFRAGSSSPDTRVTSSGGRHRGACPRPSSGPAFRASVSASFGCGRGSFTARCRSGAFGRSLGSTRSRMRRRCSRGTSRARTVARSAVGSRKKPGCRAERSRRGSARSAAFPLWRRSFLGAAASKDYLGWLRAQRLRWLRSGRVPPPASLRLDRGAMSAARLLEKATERVAWSVATRSGWSALPHYPVVKGLRTLTHPEYASAAMGSEPETVRVRLGARPCGRAVTRRWQRACAQR
jgi:hypothetical protein